MKSPATSLAELQDEILAIHLYTPAKARQLLDRLSTFEPFLATQPVSNLTVRQRVLQYGLVQIAGEAYPIPVGGVLIGSALASFYDLIRNGYWAESASYFEYTAMAFEWLWKVRGVEDLDIAQTIRNVRGNYLALVSPDGTIPLPECR